MLEEAPKLAPPEAREIPKRRLAVFGRTAVEPSVELKENRTALPEGYTYASKIKNKELAEHFRQVEIGKHMTNREVRGRERRLRSQGVTPIDVGVRDANGKLVGFGSLYQQGENGELGDFVVNPDHQGKGIGKAIIDERLRLAEEAGVTSLYMPYLEHTNTLTTYYLEKGFKQDKFGQLGRGPNPVALTGYK